MVTALAEEFPEHPTLQVLPANILECDLRPFGPCVLAGNLPYYISSPIMSQVFAAQGAWQRAVFWCNWRSPSAWPPRRTPATTAT